MKFDQNPLTPHLQVYKWQISSVLSISNRIGINVDIQNNKRNKGKISFEYKDLDQLNKIIDIIKSNY